MTLDGDYFKSAWDKTGVVEADCFVCHLPGYNFKDRSRQLISQNFKWASTAASGIAQVIGTVREGQTPKVVYNKRLFNEDGKIKGRLQGKKPNKPELHTPAEIKLMLTALTETLQGNKRFQQVRPAYHKGGQIHYLDDKGEVVTATDETWCGEGEGFNINHTDKSREPPGEE